MFLSLLLACATEAERRFPVDAAEAFCSKLTECEASSFPSHEACVEEWTAGIGCLAKECDFNADLAEEYLAEVDGVACEDVQRVSTVATAGIFATYENCEPSEYLECLVKASE